MAGAPRRIMAPIRRVGPVGGGSRSWSHRSFAERRRCGRKAIKARISRMIRCRWGGQVAKKCRFVRNCAVFIRRIGANSAARSGSSARPASASAAAGRIWWSCAVCRMGAGSMRRRRPGAIIAAGRHAGPTWLKSHRPGSPGRCWRQRISTTIRPTIGRPICGRCASAVTCCMTGLTIWRSAGSLTVGALRWATSFLALMFPLEYLHP